MKTRMELWKSYREEIVHNQRLQEVVAQSNKKMQIIRKRILNVFPDFFEKHAFEFSEKKPQITPLNEETRQLSSKKISEILKEIELLEKHNQPSLKEIENLSFSSDLEKTLHKMSQKTHEIQNFGSKFQNQRGLNAKKIHIAIDGPSASGKSSVAKLVAQKHNMVYVNTGLVYRAIAFILEQNKVKLRDTEKIKSILEIAKISILEDEQIRINNEKFAEELRQDQISNLASKVAKMKFVREFATKLIQQCVSHLQKVIMDGRDTTFRVLPEADLKFFIDSDVEVRAKRRVKQNEELGFPTDVKKIRKELVLRDKQDYHRKVDPLQIVQGAIVVDASKLSLEQTVQVLERHIKVFLETKNEK